MASDAIILLPEEIIVYILEDKQLDFSDIVNFSSTCKIMRELLKNEKLWKTKFFQRWPLLKEVYQMNKNLDYQIIWKEEIKASLSSRKKLFEHLSLMSSKHYKKQELSDSKFREYDPLFRPEYGAHPLAYYFLVDELISLLKYPAIISNLTHRYYALKVVRYLKQTHLRDEWKKFISLPPKQQTLERGATIVAQWSQPERHVSYLTISSALDNITEQTKEQLKEDHPTHSMFSVPPERFNFWKNHIIDDNQWNVLESKQVTDALCKVLFTKLGFYGNNGMYYYTENSFIDCVLEHRVGTPTTLAIVFESVARRLGIRCESVGFPSHFLLRWKETYGPESRNIENYYIDVINGGQLVTKKTCPAINGISRCPIERYNTYEAATAVEVVARMAFNLEIAVRQHTHINGRNERLRSAVELLYLVQPDDENVNLQLTKMYVMYADFEKVLKYEQKREVKLKKRVSDVKYAIGLIMRHKIHGYLCVITGWDPHHMPSIQYKDEMDIDELDKGANQPFYKVCVDDGSCYYVAQENLLLAPNPEWINHLTIGKYFYKFKGTHYVPNEEKAKEYPEDEKVRNELLNAYV